jgi:outer membrane protein OmpA-like peptidoglycan-associated protein
MAELNVQPKKKTSLLPWILLLLGLAALIWFLTRDKDNDVADRNRDAETTSVPTTSTADNNTVTNVAADWSGIDFNAPSVKYDEITDKNINVRGNNNYGIYGLGENILFDEGQATIRSSAENNLKEIAGSIGKRYNGGDLRVYGYTDATGSAGVNKELAQQRAEAVKMWLQKNGADAEKISVNAVGEAKPVASNSTDEGRQQNRRVEIVARATNTPQ